ncbi:MAG: hypothetical protein AB7O56_00540 [Bauldia sp.]
MVKRAALLLLAILAAAPAVGQENPVARCDALAGEAVPLDVVEAQPAMDACAAAVAAQPANPQLIHQYARALEAAGRLDDARRLYQWAADDAFAPAVAALRRLDGIGAGGPDWAAGERERLADGLAALSGALRRYLNGLPPDPSDPLTILAEVGGDTDALVAWVRENTRLVPYLGNLRGPRGVLSDRAGNSLDRALLLAELLADAGEEVRLARTTLDPAAAEALLATTERPAAVPSLATPSREELLALFADPRMPEAEVEAAVDQMLAARTRIETTVPEQTGTLVPILVAAVGGAIDGAAAEVRAAALGALADHFWVQLRRGGRWIDLDPDASIVGPQVAAETLAPDALPDELRHQVTVRLVLELQDAAGRREEQLLDYGWFTADRPAEALVLSHAFSGLEAIDQLLGAADVGDRVLGLLDAETAWTPMLRTADTLVADRLFTADGMVREANLAVFAGTGAAIGGLFADVGDLLGGGEPVAAEPAIPTAEWIEIEIRAPGAEPRTERRAIFDLVGPAARAAGTMVEIGPDQLRQRALRLAGPTDIFVFAAGASDVELERASVSAVATLADNVRSVAATEAFPPVDEVPYQPRIPLALLQYANERLAHGGGAPISAANVVLMHERFDWDGAAATRRLEFDIVFNDVAGDPEAGLAQGVADTVLEDALAGDESGANAAAIHLADIAAGLEWRLVTAADIGGEGDFVARLRADVDAGFLVVAPPDFSDPARLAWWRIDPRTGNALGLMPSGGGATFAEAAFLFAEGAATAGCFVGIAMAMSRMLGVQASMRKAVGLCLLAGGVGALGLGIGAGVGGMGVIFLLSMAGAEAATAP